MSELTVKYGYNDDWTKCPVIFDLLAEKIAPGPWTSAKTIRIETMLSEHSEILLYNSGEYGHYRNVSVIAVACLNSSVPIEVVELLIRRCCESSSYDDFARRQMVNHRINDKSSGEGDFIFKSPDSSPRDDAIFKILVKFDYLWYKALEQHLWGDLTKEKCTWVPDALLYNLLSTGLDVPCTYRRKMDWSKEITDDALKMIKEYPRMINYSDGELRCRDKVSAFYIACLNNKVPVEVIDAMLTADPKLINNQILVNGKLVCSIADSIHNHSNLSGKLIGLMEKYDAHVSIELRNEMSKLGEVEE